MNRMLLVYIILIGSVTSGSFLIEDSPYEGNVVAERAPWADPLPTDLDRRSAQQYAVRFEETRLENALLYSRNMQLDYSDELVTRCSAVNVRRVGADTFRVDLRCHGDIVDVYRPIQLFGFDYTVSYRITPESIDQVALDGFPFKKGGNLEPGTPPNAVELTTFVWYSNHPRVGSLFAP